MSGYGGKEWSIGDEAGKSNNIYLLDKAGRLDGISGEEDEVIIIIRKLTNKEDRASRIRTKVKGQLLLVC